MNPAVNLMIDREMSRYKSNLASWAQQVRAQRSALEAFRLAGHKPNPGSLITSLKHLANAERMRAEQSVERILEDHATNLDPSDPQFPTFMRLCQGHWPRIFRTLDDKRMKAAR